MEKQVFNEAQLHLLRMMSYVKTSEELDDIRDALASYYAQKVDEEMDALWAAEEISPATIEKWGKEHMRTPYK